MLTNGISCMQVTCAAIVGSQYLVTGSEDKTLLVWNLENLTKSERTLLGHLDAVTCITGLTGDDVVSGSADVTLRVWNAQNGACKRVLFGHQGPVLKLQSIPPADVLMHPDFGRDLNSDYDVHSSILVASSSEDGTVRLWNAASWDCLHVLDVGATPECLLAIPRKVRSLKVWAHIGVLLDGALENVRFFPATLCKRFIVSC